jgi:hypothetical protein
MWVVGKGASFSDVDWGGPVSAHEAERLVAGEN